VKITVPLLGLFVTVMSCSPVRVLEGSVMQSVWLPDVPQTGPTAARAGSEPTTNMQTLAIANMKATPARTFITLFLPIVALSLPMARTLLIVSRDDIAPVT
jgi:hypothetical protein